MNFIAPNRRKQNALLAGAALGLLVATGVVDVVRADGGNGGGTGAGAGGAGNTGAAGTNATLSQAGGGGGAGGGSGAPGGGKGGNGGGAFGGIGGDGGTAPTPNGGNGQDGTAPGFSGGGGGGGFGGGAGNGGGGGNGANAFSGGTGSGDTVTGGSGGGGGGGGSGIGVGGGGGAGGAGASMSSTWVDHTPGAIVTVNVTAGAGGNAGDGGVGNQQTGSINLATNSTGGTGGPGGTGGNATASATADGDPVLSTPSVTANGGAGGAGGRGGTGLEVAGSGIAVVHSAVATGGNGGAGGLGGASNTTGISGGGVVAANGSAGKGGDGNSGGVGAMFGGSAITFTNSGTVQGGIGGVGGNGGDRTVLVNGGPPIVRLQDGIAGNGGSGGNAVQFGGASGTTLINSGFVLGGTGGDGGDGGTAGGGNGGNGGHAVAFSGTGGRIVNSGTVRGGNGGLDGAGLAGFAGVGGYGVIGAGLTIENNGTIAGGNDGAGLLVQYAIALIGGDNAIGGSGTIVGGIQLLGGSLSPALPGSAVGPTLNVNGPVLLAAGSTYNIRVNGAANDSLTVGGTATVGGAGVAATITGNALGQHTIITANSISGTFASVSTFGNSAFLTAALSYDPTHVYLNITGNAAGGGIDFTTAAQTVNQFNVASALNSAGNANGFSGPVINLVAQLSASQARAAFTALDGEVATGAERAAFRFGDQFLNLMLNPFVDGRFDNAGGITGYAAEAALPEDMARAYASVLKAPPLPHFEQRWSLWGAGFGGSGKTSGDPVVVGSTDTRLSTWGIAGGIDYRLSPHTVIGLAAAGGATNWGLSNGLGNGRSESAQVGAYARTRIGAAYIAESIAFANHWFTTDRTALGDNLRGTFTGQSFGARVEGGYRFAVAPNFGVTPYAAAQAQAFHSGAYTETDLSNLGFGLSYAAKNATDIRTELGARFDAPTLVNGMPVVLRARLAWAHDFVDTPSLNAAFQTLPLSNFTVSGAAIPQDSGLVSLGVDWYLNRDWKLLAKFDGEFAKNADIYAGSVALRYSW